MRIRYVKGLVISAIGLSGLFYSALLMQGCDPISVMGQNFPSLYKATGAATCEYHTFTEVHDAIVSVADPGSDDAATAPKP